jgi:hypothetical protein
MNFTITVANKIAVVDAATEPIIVCGNSSYVIDFLFDSEWNDYKIKNAIFTYKRNGETKHIEVVFTGTKCNVPILTGIQEVFIGVYAGELHTTTSARVACKKSALCDVTKAEDPPKDVYSQLLEILKNNYPLEAAINANEAAAEANEAAANVGVLSNKLQKFIEETENTLPYKIKADIVDSTMGVLLWENQNIDADFEAQTVELDLTKYNRIVILFCESSLHFEFSFTTKDIAYTVHKPGYHRETSAYGRNLTISNTGIVFSDGRDNSTDKIENSAAKPYRIYGYNQASLNLYNELLETIGSLNDELETALDGGAE